VNLVNSNLVNSRATRQVSGRTSAVLDCPWICPLMTYGRLKGAFRPANEIGSLRDERADGCPQSAGQLAGGAPVRPSPGSGSR